MSLFDDDDDKPPTKVRRPEAPPPADLREASAAVDAFEFDDTYDARKAARDAARFACPKATSKFETAIEAARDARGRDRDDQAISRLKAARASEIGDASLREIDRSIGVFVTPGYQQRLRERDVALLGNKGDDEDDLCYVGQVPACDDGTAGLPPAPLQKTATTKPDSAPPGARTDPVCNPDLAAASAAGSSTRELELDAEAIPTEVRLHAAVAEVEKERARRRAARAMRRLPPSALAQLLHLYEEAILGRLQSMRSSS